MGLLNGIGRFFTGKPLLGRPEVIVEIGTEWVKAAHIKSGLFGGSTVANLQIIEIPKGEQSLNALLQPIIRMLTLGRHPIFLLLPRNLVTVRILRIPSADPDEVDRMVRLQASRQTPYSKEEVVYASRIIDTDEQGYSKVMLIIARRGLIDERTQALQQAGAQVAQVGVSTEGTCAWFARSATAQAVSGITGLVDIDAATSEISVFHHGKLAFTRNILIGANQLLEEPEKWQTELNREIQESLDRYRSENPSDNVTTMILTGARSGRNAMQESLGKTLRMPVSVTGHVEQIPLQGDKSMADSPAMDRVSLAALCGASVDGEEQKIDLRPPEIKVETVVIEKRKQLNIMGGLAILIVTLIGLMIFFDIYEKNAELTAIEGQIAAVKPAAELVEEMTAKIQTVTARLDARGRPLTLLTEIHRATPANIQVTSLNITARGQINISGRGLATSDVLAYVAALEESPLLQGVRTTYTSMRKIENREVAEFSLLCTYEPEKSDGARQQETSTSGSTTD